MTAAVTRTASVACYAIEGHGWKKMITMTKYKYTDKNHPPVPRLKVGDICYAHSDFGRYYDYVAKCEVRKVEVKWFEPSEYDREHLGWCGYWHIDYYIRMFGPAGRKETKMFAYHSDEDGDRQNLFFTPQEVMDDNIRDFTDMVQKTIVAMQKKMFSLGYTQEQTRKLLEYKIE